MNSQLREILLKSYFSYLGKEKQTEELKPDEFVELHFHTEHSALDGATRVAEIAKVVKEHGQTAVAVTDHGTMSGIFDVYAKCKKAGIKLIPAMEPYIVEDLNNLPPPRRRRRKSKKTESSKKAEDKRESQKEEQDPEEDHSFTSLDREGHIVLIAKNEIGYRNLLELHYLGYMNKRTNTYGRVVPRLDFNLIAKRKEGLILGTACIGSPVGQLIIKGEIEKAEQLVLKLKETFGEDFYLELQPVGTFPKEKERLQYRIEQTEQTEKLQILVNKQLIEFGLKHNIMLCVTSDAHYARKEDRETHALLLAIQSKKDITDEDCFFFPAAYMLDTEELLTLFPAEWIRNTKIIADRCEEPTYLEFGKDYKIPEFEIPKDAEFQEWLKDVSK